MEDGVTNTAVSRYAREREREREKERERERETQVHGALRINSSPLRGGIEWLRPLLCKGEQGVAVAEHGRAVGATSQFCDLPLSSLIKHFRNRFRSSQSYPKDVACKLREYFLRRVRQLLDAPQPLLLTRICANDAEVALARAIPRIFVPGALFGGRPQNGRGWAFVCFVCL